MKGFAVSIHVHVAILRVSSRIKFFGAAQSSEWACGHAAFTSIEVYGMHTQKISSIQRGHLTGDFYNSSS